MDEKISVIVPVYNVRKYIVQCVESLINQTYHNLEIILVDDGSTDRSGDICDEMQKKDNRIKVIHTKNSGLSSARNKGIDMSSGEYIGFVDSDDWVFPEMFEKMLESMKSINADISVCGWIEEFCNTARKRCPFDKLLDNNQAMMALLKNTEIADHAWDKLYRAKLFEGIRYPDGKTYEDIRTTYKLFARSNRIIFVPETFYHYRQRKGSIARGSFNLRKMEWLDAVKELSNDPLILSNDTFKEIMNERVFHTQCFLLREMLLNTDDTYLKKCMPFVDEYYKELRKKWLYVVFSDGYSLSIKMMAIATLGGKYMLIKSIHSKWYKRYIGDKYRYYD